MTEEKVHAFIKKVGKSPFKDERNQWRTRNLFLELRSRTETPMFTIYDEDRKGCKSLKKIYMSYNHIPGYEYDFAVNELGGWEHWQILQGTSSLKEMIQQWKNELDIKIKAKALRNVMYVASDKKNAQQLSASRYLADKGYVPKDESRGRPSKSEREAKLKEDIKIKEELADDMTRLGIKVVK